MKTLAGPDGEVLAGAAVGLRPSRIAFEISAGFHLA